MRKMFVYAALIGAVLGLIMSFNGNAEEVMTKVLIGAISAPALLWLVMMAAFAFGLGRGLNRHRPNPFDFHDR